MPRQAVERPLSRGDIWAVAGVGVAFAALGFPLMLGVVASTQFPWLGLTLGIFFSGISLALLGYAWINLVREKELARKHRRRRRAALETVRYFLLEIDKLQGSRPRTDGDCSSDTTVTLAALGDLPEDHPERVRERFREILDRHFCVYPFNKSALVELMAQMPGKSRLGYVQEVLLRRQADIEPWITPD